MKSTISKENPIYRNRGDTSKERAINLLESKNLLNDHVRKQIKVVRNNTSEVAKDNSNSKTNTFSLVQRESIEQNGSMTSPLKKDGLQSKRP
jgi:hypothetical protein